MRNTSEDYGASLSSEPAREVEVFPGMHERRHFLRGSLVTAAAVLALKALPKNIRAQAPAGGTPMAGNVSGTDRLGWDEFLKQAIPVGQQLLADPAFSFDEYLYRIGFLATRLKEIPDCKLGSYAAVDSRVWFGPSFRGSPFFIIQWRMDPGAILP